jgi:hypothetical protein
MFVVRNLISLPQSPIHGRVTSGWIFRSEPQNMTDIINKWISFRFEGSLKKIKSKYCCNSLKEYKMTFSSTSETLEQKIQPDIQQ